ncbi:MAG: diaminopimelate decarboxylase [Bacteroidaceae bacterium]|nr:diaminopimelate decarboxylase [Bacteroidaceae bacterium]
MKTPFYYYNTALLKQTLNTIIKESGTYNNFFVHYAVKANTNPTILQIIQESGIGVDCVSGGEIQASLNAGFVPEKIVFAGVGKTDYEIELGLDKNILCFNVESQPELEVINELAGKRNKVANICFRVNPNVDAHTHDNIATGKQENKFGIPARDLLRVIQCANNMSNINFKGLHFHIGSQILDMIDFRHLCSRINELVSELKLNGINIDIINVGGGLGIDYNKPENNPIPNFKDYFNIFATYLNQEEHQEIHFELGRSVVGQCGQLITKVTYVKETGQKRFAIVDAGMTDLIRPALYQAHHEIRNLTNSKTPYYIYDVVGPICESSDVFDTDVSLPEIHRGDYLAILSAGAYGEIMASQYNCRTLPQGYVGEGKLDLAQIL